MSNTLIIAVFFLSMLFLMFGIIKLKVNAGMMMLITAVLTGLALGMPSKDLIGAISGGFGGMMSALGIVV